MFNNFICLTILDIGCFKMKYFLYLLFYTYFFSTNLLAFESSNSHTQLLYCPEWTFYTGNLPYKDWLGLQSKLISYYSKLKSVSSVSLGAYNGSNYQGVVVTLNNGYKFFIGVDPGVI